MIIDTTSQKAPYKRLGFDGNCPVTLGTERKVIAMTRFVLALLTAAAAGGHGASSAGINPHEKPDPVTVLAAPQPRLT